MATIADRYDLLAPLGRGGMATVHRARDRVLGREVAVKVLRADVALDAVARERFLREAQLAAGLNHQRIVRVYDAGIDDSHDSPWIAMELVEGPSLAERLAREGPLPEAEARALLDAVLDGLAAAHAAGVVHRDLKPANILLAPDGPKLTDFGIAKSLVAAASDLTQAHQFMGTPKYAAPEVSAGQPATPTSDVYSAGVIAYEVLAGQPPFEHPNPLTLAMLHQTDPVPSLLEQRADLTPGLAAAVMAALAKDPSRRPASAEAFRRLLRDGAPTPAAPPPAAPPPATVPEGMVATQVLPQPVGAAGPGPGVSPPAGPPPSTPRQPPRRRGGGVVWLVLLVLALLAAAAYAFTLGGDDPDEAPSETPSPTVSPEPASPTATPSTATPTEPTGPAAPPPAAPAPAPGDQTGSPPATTSPAPSTPTAAPTTPPAEPQPPPATDPPTAPTTRPTAPPPPAPPPPDPVEPAPGPTG